MVDSPGSWCDPFSSPFSWQIKYGSDQLSTVNTPYEWKLHPNVFKFLDKIWGPCTDDRFAAMHNTQLPRYNSLYMDPNTEGVDVLAQVWSGENNHANPPFWQIPKILNLIVEQKMLSVELSLCLEPLPSALSCHNITVNHQDVPTVNHTWQINIHK